MIMMMVVVVAAVVNAAGKHDSANSCLADRVRAVHAGHALGTPGIRRACSRTPGMRQEPLHQVRRMCAGYAGNALGIRWVSCGMRRACTESPGKHPGLTQFCAGRAKGRGGCMLSVPGTCQVNSNARARLRLYSRPPCSAFKSDEVDSCRCFLNGASLSEKRWIQ